MPAPHRPQPGRSPRAVAGTRRSPRLVVRPGDAERTSCGLILTGNSLGVSHPVLPCGARLLLRFAGQTVLTEVIDNKLKSAGRQFELTERLAADLGLDGTQEIDWRFAARPAGIDLRALGRVLGVFVSAKDHLRCDVLDPVRGPEFQREPRLIKGACVRRRLCQRLAAHPPGSPGSQLASGFIGRVGRLLRSAAVLGGRVTWKRYGLRRGVHPRQP